MCDKAQPTSLPRRLGSQHRCMLRRHSSSVSPRLRLPLHGAKVKARTVCVKGGPVKGSRAPAPAFFSVEHSQELEHVRRRYDNPNLSNKSLKQLLIAQKITDSYPVTMLKRVELSTEVPGPVSLKVVGSKIRTPRGDAIYGKGPGFQPLSRSVSPTGPSMSAYKTITQSDHF
jgi:hypothetical protein